jgi:hypothetical protein
MISELHHFHVPQEDELWVDYCIWYHGYHICNERAPQVIDTYAGWFTDLLHVSCLNLEEIEYNVRALYKYDNQVYTVVVQKIRVVVILFL